VTQRINLMPAACKERFDKRNRLRVWITVYLGSIAIIGVATVGLRTTFRPSHEELAMLDARATLTATQNAQVARLTKEVTRVRALIDRHKRLAWPIAISDTIAIVGHSTPSGVSIKTLAVTPRKDANNASKPAANSQAADSKPGSILLLEVRGVASSDAQIAQFVAGLESSPLFEGVTLDYARRAQASGADTRGFGITCRIDATRTYRFDHLSANADVDEEETP